MAQVLLYHEPQLLAVHLAHTWLGAGGSAETHWGYWGSPAGISWPCQGKSFHFLCPVPGRGSQTSPAQCHLQSQPATAQAVMAHQAHSFIHDTNPFIHDLSSKSR